jgi:hypothetical protein
MTTTNKTVVDQGSGCIIIIKRKCALSKDLDLQQYCKFFINSPKRNGMGQSSCAMLGSVWQDGYLDCLSQDAYESYVKAAKKIADEPKKVEIGPG